MFDRLHVPQLLKLLLLGRLGLITARRENGRRRIRGRRRGDLNRRKKDGVQTREGRKKERDKNVV
jgi:hypothetical protein